MSTVHNWTNNMGLPAPLCRAIEHFTNLYSPGEAKRSCTSLNDSPLIWYLWKVYGDQVVVDYSRAIYRVWGQIMHFLMSEFPGEDEEHVEERLFAEFDGWIISGQIDYLVMNKKIVDYKMTSTYNVSNGIKDEWVEQQNVYLHLLRKQGELYGVDISSLFNCDSVELQICTMLRNWGPRHKVQFPAPVAMFDVPVWTPEQAEDHIIRRISLHREAEELDVMPPQCTKKERWIRPENYAVMKKGNKRATKRFKTEDYDGDIEQAGAAAEAFAAEKGPDHEVVLRESKPMRCLEYCDVADFCPYFKQDKEEAAEAGDEW